MLARKRESGTPRGADTSAVRVSDIKGYYGLIRVPAGLPVLFRLCLHEDTVGSPTRQAERVSRRSGLPETTAQNAMRTNAAHLEEKHALRVRDFWSCSPELPQPR